MKVDGPSVSIFLHGGDSSLGRREEGTGVEGVEVVQEEAAAGPSLLLLEGGSPWFDSERKSPGGVDGEGGGGESSSDDESSGMSMSRVAELINRTFLSSRGLSCEGSRKGRGDALPAIVCRRVVIFVNIAFGAVKRASIDAFHRVHASARVSALLEACGASYC